MPRRTLARPFLFRSHVTMENVKPGLSSSASIHLLPACLSSSMNSRLDRSKLTTAALGLFFLVSGGLAGQATDQIRKADLSGRTFAVRDLKLTIKRFWPGSILTRGYVEVRVENPSDSASTFNPQRLLFASRNDKQVNVRGRRQTGPVNPNDPTADVALPIEIAPRAYLNELYELDGRVLLPARLIYEGEELAIVVK